MVVELKVYVEPLPQDLWIDGLGAEAFDEMYRRCHQDLVSLCRRLLCGRGDPEAVAQEAFLRAWTSLDRFSAARPFWPWMATIARRLCIDHRRRLHREAVHATSEMALHASGPVPSPEENLETDEEYRSACEALRRLKPAEQRVIALREVNGWSYEEIARFEGVTVESIRGALKRARTSLRRSYASLAGGAPAAATLHWVARMRERTLRAMARCRRLSLSPDLVSIAAFHEVVVGATALVAALGGLGGAGAPPTSLAAVPASYEADVDAARVAPTSPEVASAAPAPRRGFEGPASDGGKASLLPDRLLDDGGDTPEATGVTSITPSPHAEDDGTVYMSGTVRGCAYPPCPALFRSRDGGVAWQRLPATGFVGGDVLLPPSYPADPRIFVASPAGLQVSTDDGASFTTVTPVGGSAAMSPRFSDGDARILVSGSPVWEYRDGSPVSAPAPFLRAPSAGTGGLAFLPDGAGRSVLLGGTRLGTDGRHEAAVFTCDDAVCDEGVPLAGVVGSPSLAVPATAGPSFAWRGTSLFRSDQDGRSFEPVALPTQGTVTTVVFGPSGNVYVGVAGSVDQAGGGLLVSPDGGLTWSVLGQATALAKGVTAVAVLPSGRLLAGLAPEAGGGILCSVDSGVSWSPRCG